MIECDCAVAPSHNALLMQEASCVSDTSANKTSNFKARGLLGRFFHVQ